MNVKANPLFKVGDQVNVKERGNAMVSTLSVPGWVGVYHDEAGKELFYRIEQVHPIR